MGTIHICQEHNLSVDEARERLGAFEEQMRQYGAKLVWKGPRAEVTGLGVSGSAVITESLVELTLKLGILARAAGVDEDRLRGSITRRLVIALAEDGDDGDSAQT
jgi:putative polyhydroxyalkanoate system protein